jgi:hypothetical protein
VSAPARSSPTPRRTTFGVPYWNCFYDKRTMYDPGDATHSYYQVRAKTQDGKSKYVCFLYWKQSWARKQNVCIEW